MRFTDGATMREIDRKAIEEYGIPSLVLMENAAVKTVVALEKAFGRMEGRRALVVCGPGNNGGDGMAVARHLHNAGVEVACALLRETSRLSPDAAVQAKILDKMGLSPVACADEGSLASLDDLARGADLLVDAIFGTGLARPVEGIDRRAIELLNAARGKRLSIDLPSGVCADTGRTLGAAVRADATVALGLPKAGHFLPPGAGFTGRLFVADIGIPRELFAGSAPPRELIDTAAARERLPARAPDGHKGTFGRVIALAGSSPYAGAALLTALGAMRIGAGLVTLASTRECLDLLTARHPEATRLELPSTGAGGIDAAALRAAFDEAALETAVFAIGPGLGRDGALLEACRDLFSRARRAVLDADGLHALTGGGRVDGGERKVITPHPGEAAALLGVPREEVNADRIGAARELSSRFGVNALLKGAGSVLALTDGAVRINTSGSNALAKGGSGDVLAGFVAGLMAQGAGAGDAATLAAFLHGASGERAAKERSDYSVLPAEIADGVGQVIMELGRTAA